eukprot:CAMPEP_0206051696 /NCGR_PEP_ID=MMETSP1466-20131121/32057_1 /ASSEMBLY_ACC=CAM_ASM_001126 /TAXON_ID=44452 /ORGANISM="Pavlova gyrans, Strain CCMP608" /LENGTH=31 /DNA_ID= /DNA_START= /DNA_END= /DNA_ORIENTATION=
MIPVCGKILANLRASSRGKTKRVSVIRIYWA